MDSLRPILLLRSDIYAINSLASNPANCLISILKKSYGDNRKDINNIWALLFLDFQIYNIKSELVNIFLKFPI